MVISTCIMRKTLEVGNKKGDIMEEKKGPKS